MKPAITTTTTILGCVLAAGLASAQSPSIIQNTRNTMNAVSDKATAASNEALGIQQPGVHPAVGRLERYVRRRQVERSRGCAGEACFIFIGVPCARERSGCESCK